MKTRFYPLLFIIALASCRVDPPVVIQLPGEELKEIVPQGWPEPVYRFSNNPISKEKFELGRALFYETLLSKDNSISCGTCHQPFAAFANADHRVSHGINDLEGTRNSPALFNLNWHTSFMHDGGINHIESQPLGPIQNPIEMAESISNVLTKLSNTEKYRRMFREAFGSEEISSFRLQKSLAQFMGLMYSFNSKYDQFKRRENNVSLSDAEARGYNLFLANCNSCHKEPLFSDFKFRNNGLRVDPVVQDSGRARITLRNEDLYKFKTPSLRNIAKTSPYMHDGSLGTLEECLDHYTSGINNHTNLDPLLSYGLPLSGQDKKDIIAFLHTLTDPGFISDKRFSEPKF